MVIKAVVIDIGDVLIDESGTRSRDYIADKYGFDGQDFWEYVKRNLGKSYCGEFEAEDFFEGLIDELGLGDVDAKDMVDDWLKAREQTSKVNEIVTATLGELKGKYVLGVLSDSTKLNEKVSARKGCYAPFDFVILSCDVGVRKPDRKIYEILVEGLAEKGVKPEEAVFVDDKESNLGPAEELGIKTILFEDGEQMIRDLRELGVEC